MHRKRVQRNPIETLERRTFLSGESMPPPSVGFQPTGALTGKIIFTGAGHGFTAANTGTGLWSTQRGETNEMVEDMGNFDQMAALIPYLFNAGATIVPTRPVGHQTNEVVVDNINATFTGSWSNGASTPYFSTSNGTGVFYRTSAGSATETASARFTPNIPTPGFYPVYGWALNGTNRLPDQTYRVVHTGGTTEVKINHQRVGKGWVYLGTYYFDAGTTGFVEVSNKTSSGTPGSFAAVADAIRFGNGMGDITRGADTSGQSREDEASLYWVQAQAGWTSPGVRIAESTYRGGNSEDGNANVGAPVRWGSYMNDGTLGTMFDRLYLSYHSNAAGGRGTVGLYNGNNNPATMTPHQFDWALAVAKEVNDDLVALSPTLEAAWDNHTTNGSLTLDRSDIEFGEINNTIINGEFDATILEVAFHDDPTDALLMRDPKVRNYVARASVQSMVKYFNQFTGSAINLAPDAPTNVRAVTQANGSIFVSWAAPVVDGIGGQAATGYKLYRSDNGYGFDAGVTIAGGGTLTYTIPAGEIGSGATYIRVAANNLGGESVPSEVVGARRNLTGAAPILIVNGFDRLHRTLNPTQTTDIDNSSSTVSGTEITFDRVRQRFSNSFDYTIQAGDAIEAYSNPLGFDTVQNEAVISGAINLGSYSVVIWLSGEESTADDSFNATEQALVTSYLNSGGRLFVSGSEIGWDLVAQGGGATFYNSALRSGYVNDDANTYNVSGAVGSIFAGLSFAFDNGTQFYDPNFPDTLSAINGSVVAMNYSGGGAAGLQYSNVSGTRIVNLGFPFETITTPANRNAVMAAVLKFFDTTSPTVSVTPVTPDPTPGPVSSIAIVFSEAVQGFTLSDLTFSRNGSANLLTGAQTLSTSDNINWILNGLASLTDVSGVFALTLPAGTVTDIAGNSLNSGGVEQFKVQTTKFRGDAIGSVNDSWIVRINPNDATQVQIFENIVVGPTPSYVLPLASLAQLQFEGLLGTDSLTFDLAQGSPAPSGFRFIGTGADSLTLTGGGSMTLPTDLANDAPNLTMRVLAGATATMTAGATHLDGLEIASNGRMNMAAGSSRRLVTKSLSLSTGGTLDLNDQDLIVEYTGVSPIDDIIDNLVSGRDGGNWNGAGITSSAAANANPAITTLGVLESSDFIAASGGNIFAGEPIDATAVLVKYTWYGDSDLNGVVDFDDYVRIDSGINSGSTTWFAGDSDLNGVVDFDDYVLIDGAFNGQVGVL